MFKKVTAVFLACAGLASLLSCGTVINQYVIAAVPAANELVVYREDPNSGILTVLAGSPFAAGLGVQSVALHPSGKFFYAANSGEGDISLFTLSAGVPTEQPPRTSVTPGGTTPEILAVDSAGAYLYVANVGSNNVSVFSIASNGDLSEVSGSPFPIGMQPLNMAIAPSGNFLYVTGGTFSPGSLEVFSLSAGVLAFVQSQQTGTSPNGLVIDPTGSYLYAANTEDGSISEFAIQSDGTVNPISGSPVFESPTSSAPIALLVDKASKFLFVANQGANNVAGFSIGSGGGLSVLSNSPFTSNKQPVSLALDPSGEFVFVGNSSSPAIQSFSMNTSAGTLTSVGSYPVGNTATSIFVAK